MASPGGLTKQLVKILSPSESGVEAWDVLHGQMGTTEQEGMAKGR